MGLFSRPQLPANLSDFKPRASVVAQIGATIAMPELRGNHSCTFLLGPVNDTKAEELLHWLETEARHLKGYTPEEVIWSLSESLKLNGYYFPDRVLVELERFGLYQARLKEYCYAEVSDIVKAAKVSMRKGNPLEFVYSSVRNFTNGNWQEASAHTVLVKRMDEEGFVGTTALGPRRFTWQRVEYASLLAVGSLASERAIRLEFIGNKQITNSREDILGNLEEPRLVMALGENRGKGLYLYGYPHSNTDHLGFGNS